MKKFVCNICGTENSFDPLLTHRELIPCIGCGSNARFRALMLGLSFGLTGSLRRLDELEIDLSVKGFGCSDAEVYASRLRRMFAYTNTFFHQEPRLDLADEKTYQQVSGSQFAICSDVIEHTLQPPQVCLKNLYDSLAPNGFLILSAPTYAMPYSMERYPTLTDYTITQLGEQHVVVYKSAQGPIGLDSSPIFHGGPGSVLEMRVLSHNQLIAELAFAGFKNIKVMGDSFEVFGAHWEPMVDRNDIPYELDGRIIVARR
jgi:SAM-dependent methyltransferase